MTLEDDIRLLAKKEGVLAYFVEKEYIQHLFLRRLFKHEGFVLKGGCCLRMVYGYKRFSRTLELISSRSEKDIKKIVHETLKNISSNLNYEILGERVYSQGYESIIEFNGPLSYKNSNISNILKISIEIRRPLLKPKKLRVSSPFVPDFKLWAMQQEEILAEKLLVMVSENNPIAAFDLFCMLKKGVRPDRKLIKEKFKEAGKKVPTSSSEIKGKSEYEKSIKNLVATFPPYETLINEIDEYIFKNNEKHYVAQPVSKTRVKVFYVVYMVALLSALALFYFVVKEGQEDNYTILYFSNPVEPIVYTADNSLAFNFTIENHEGRPMNYTYSVYLYNSTKSFKRGSVFLNDNQSITISQKIQVSNYSAGIQIFVDIFQDGKNSVYRRIWYEVGA